MIKEESLYRQYDPTQKHADVFQKDFYPGAVNIRLRPFFIEEDLDPYNKWMRQEVQSTAIHPYQQPLFTESYFAALLKSSNAQSFWGLINNEPGFQLDIYEALYYYLPDNIQGLNLVPGDSMIQLVIAPGILKDEQVCSYILQACLEYLGAFPGIRKAIWIIDPDDQLYVYIARKASFTLMSGNKGMKTAYKYIFPEF